MLNRFCSLHEPRQESSEGMNATSLWMTLLGTRLLTSITLHLDEPDPLKFNETPSSSTKLLSGPCCCIYIWWERPDIEGYSGDVELDIA